MYVGNKQVKAVYLGNRQISTAYLGSQGTLLNPEPPDEIPEGALTFEGDTDTLTFEGDTDYITFETE